VSWDKLLPPHALAPARWFAAPAPCCSPKLPRHRHTPCDLNQTSFSGDQFAYACQQTRVAVSWLRVQRARQRPGSQRASERRERAFLPPSLSPLNFLAESRCVQSGCVFLPGKEEGPVLSPSTINSPLFTEMVGPRFLAMRATSAMRPVSRFAVRPAMSRANSTSGVWEAARKVPLRSLQRLCEARG